MYLRETVTTAPDGVRVTSGPDGLALISEADCAAAIWHRPANPEITSWIEALDTAQLPKARIIVQPSAVSAALEECFEAAGTPNCPERAALIADAAELADKFARTMEAPYLRLRLDLVTTNACRRFHVDVLTARLICTYRGTGTQYGVSTKDTDPTRVFTVPTGSPIVLRGKLWPEEPASGLLHRSPPIEGTGETRSVLVLDPIYDPEEAD